MTGEPEGMFLQTFSYLSKVSGSLGRPELAHIRLASELFNERWQVTGLLLFDGQFFAQIIEGPEAGLAVVKARIMKDARHEMMLVGPQVTIAHRQFEGWSLRVVATDPQPVLDAMRQRLGQADSPRVHPEITQFFGDSLVRTETLEPRSD